MANNQIRHTRAAQTLRDGNNDSTLLLTLQGSAAAVPGDHCNRNCTDHQ